MGFVGVGRVLLRLYCRGLAAGVAACVALPLTASLVRGETLDSALVQAYQSNPSLNSQRAATRATDEGVPQALSGYRPKVTVTGTGGEQALSSTSKVVGSTIPAGSPATYFTQSGYNAPYGAGATVTQTLFNGFQTANKTRQAESAVLAARATLRVIEQTVLLNAVTAYMNLLRDSAILDLQRRNVEVLQEQLRQTRDRFNVGEVTRTDVAQSESRLAAGRSQVLSAEANYKASAATYRQVIGSNPGKLSPGSPVDRFSPSSLPGAIGSATASHPAVTTAQYNVDVAQLAVKVAEGALYPTVSVQGNFQKNYATVGNLNTIESYNASVLGSLSVPIYQGGAEYSAIRQAKETLGQKRLDLRHRARHGAPERGAVLGPARGGQGQYRGHHRAGAGRRDRAQRRARGSPRRPAHHARRAQRPAGTGECPRGAGDRPARPRGRLLLLAGGGRPAGAFNARSARAGL